jgi:elongation of very long chain fatty acids protein 7
MYSYYFLTSFRPELKQSLWWKKHITQVQMAQFTILIIHFGVPVFTACPLPKMFLTFVAVQNLFMLLLFGDFYFKAYVKKKNN